MVQSGLGQDAVGFGEWYTPETVLILAPLENGRLVAGNGDVIVVMDRGFFGTFVENGNVAIVSKNTHAE